MADRLKKEAPRRVLELRRSDLTNFAQRDGAVGDASCPARNRVDDPSLSSSVYSLNRSKLGSLDSLEFLLSAVGLLLNKVSTKQVLLYLRHRETV